MAVKSRHYERIIVACAFLLLFVNVGFTSTSFSVYQSHLVDLPGVGNVGGSFVVTIRTLVALLCMFFTDFYFKRINPRFGFLIATLCTFFAFVMFGLVENMVGLCIAAVLAGIGYGFGGMVAATYLVGNWFRGKVGSVSGVVTMGSGFAAIIVPICVGWIMENSSMQVAFYVEAAVSLFIALFIFAFVRMTPYDVGLEPVGADSKPKNSDGNVGGPTRKTRKRAAKHPKKKLSEVPLPKGAMAAMVIAIVLLGGVSVAGYNYFGILLSTNGIDMVMAATLISLAGIFLTISKFAVGVVCDRFGTLAGSCIFFLLLVASMVLCSLVGHGGVPEAALAAIMLGIGMPLGTTGVSLWSLELSSPERMLKTVKTFQLAYAFGGFALNMMPGTLAQLTGTYNSTYYVLIALSVICAAMVITVYARHILRARQAYSKEHGE